MTRSFGRIVSVGIFFTCALSLTAYWTNRQRIQYLQLKGCVLNQTNLALALEEWAVKYNQYPSQISELVPVHLKFIPTCPSAGRDTYSCGYNPNEPNNFKLYCGGHHHTEKGFPQYDGILGPTERPLANSIVLPPEPRTLSLLDLEYGRSQVDRMMRDRPAMAEVVEKGDAIYEWASRRFGGLSCGQRIGWHSGPERGSARASCRPPRPGVAGSIFLRLSYKGKDLSAQQLWSRAVFELHNISNGPLWAELEKRVLDGSLSKSEYIEEGSRLEYYAEIKTLHFFRDVWRPYANSKGISVESYSWRANLPKTFSSWKEIYWDEYRVGYPYDNFGTRYDKILEHRCARTRDPLLKTKVQ
jgi:hypothetical protein